MATLMKTPMRESGHPMMLRMSENMASVEGHDSTPRRCRHDANARHDEGKAGD
jgi:hypothetical protein